MTTFPHCRLLPRLNLWLGLVFASLLTACGESSINTSPLMVPARETGSAPAAARYLAGNPLPVNYEREAATLDAAIADALRLIAKQTDNTLLALETVAVYLERARLTGNYDDYQQAEALLDKAIASGNQASFPCLAQAKLHYALHRLPAANAALAACPATVDPVDLGGLAGDIAFYTGRYKEAEEIYRALVNQVGSTPQYLRLALLRNKMGSPGEAAALLEAAEKRYHGVSATMKAWLKLQRGLIAWDRGRLDEALALYHLAADELPGWWLVDEHIAEVKRFTGDTVSAQALYVSVIQRTGQPEYMDQLAQLLLEGTTPAAAAEWIKRAGTLYRQRLTSFPEASVGHALNHFMQFGTPDEALALARRNAELRPYGDAQIALAAALFCAGQAGEADELIDRVATSGWNTAQLHAVAAQIKAGLGRRAEADAQRAKAIAMNPYAMRLYALAQPEQSRLVSRQSSIDR